MPEKKDLPSSVIKYEGIFDWSLLYQTITGWFFARHYDYYEKKNVRKPRSFGVEMEFEAYCEREENPYVRNDITISIQVIDAEDIEVIENGEKKNKLKAKMMTIKISPRLTLDWNDKWESSSFKKKARAFMHKHIITRKVELWQNKVYYEAYDLQTHIKEVLGLAHKYSAYGNVSKKIIS